MIIIIFSEWLKSSIWSIDGTITGASTPGQSRSESNGYEGVLYISQTLRLEPYHQMQFDVIQRTQNVKIITKYIITILEYTVRTNSNKNMTITFMENSHIYLYFNILLI